MSLILDALRKMEQDRKSRRSEEMRSQVLRYRAPAGEKGGKPYLLLASAVILLLLGVIAGLLLKGKDQPELARNDQPPPALSATAAPVASATAAPIAAAAAPPSSPAALQASASAPAAATEPVNRHPAQKEPAPEPAKRKAPAEGEPAPAATAAVSGADPGENGVSRPRKGRAKGAAAPAAPVRSPVVQGGASDITVSGIAFQDERNLRRAVVNGTLVGEGAEVAGARVVEIKENRVRLSRGGQLFDIAMTSR